MLSISEWLPNPQGKDAGSEWVELGNSGDAPVSLQGWSLANGAGKRITLQDETVPTRGMILIPAKGLTLRNKDESIALFDPSGNLAHESHFFGTAQDGKSYSNVNGQFVFTDPTPGAPNAIPKTTALVGATYPEGGVLQYSLNTWEVVGLTLGAALAVTILCIFILTQHENLSKLVFKRNETIR